jgi:hypothetical protein
MVENRKAVHFVILFLDDLFSATAKHCSERTECNAALLLVKVYDGPVWVSGCHMCTQHLCSLVAHIFLS